MSIAIKDSSPAWSADHYGLRVLPIKYIVIHHTATRTAEITKLVLGKHGFSTHFEVDRDGSVVRYLDPEKFVAWASNWANGRCIAIDVTHYQLAFTEVQIAAVAALVAELCGTYSIAQKAAPLGTLYTNRGAIPKDVGLLRHSNVHPTECPAGFPMERLQA